MSNSQKTVAESEYSALYDFVRKHLNTIYNSIFFIAVLIAFPILTFFLTLHSQFNGNTTHAAGAAGAMAAFILCVFAIGFKLTRQSDKTKTE